MRTRKFDVVYLVLALLLSGGSAGCVRYLEEETPSGTVPPPPAPISSGLRPSQPHEVGPKPGVSGEDALPRTEAVQGMIQRFAKLYAAKGSPRIALFLNRALSDDVREWRSDSRLSVTGERTKVRAEADKKAKQTVVVAGKALSIEQPTDSGDRPSPNEQWMWAFEDGFIQPFLDAKVKVVDRATILRLTAAKEGRRTDAASMAPKTIETNALKDAADMFVEILVSRSPASLYGYEFKASVKEVKTGQVMANVTSLRWRPEDQRTRVALAGPTDYEVIEAIRIPPVDEVAGNLAIDLMNALCGAWSD